MTCCCHTFDGHCNHEHSDPHVHKCLPKGLDLGGHCPDSGCPGECWVQQGDSVINAGGGST